MWLQLQAKIINDDFDVESLGEREKDYIRNISKWTNEWYIWENDKYPYDWNQLLNQNWETMSQATTLGLKSHVKDKNIDVKSQSSHTVLKIMLLMFEDAV